MRTISIERLRAAIAYDPNTGQFRRLDGRGKPGHCGTILRAHGQSDYLLICIDRVMYYAHRLAWLYVYGKLPAAELDHINGDGLDNRLCNLREATRAQNSTNALAQKSNKTGLRGVHYHWEAKRYRAQITKDGTRKHLGYFDTPQEAYDAYLSAAKVLHGEFVRDGTRVKSVAGAIAFRE